jgi:Protein kinase domain
MTVEPGRQLAGRYRVEDLLAERAGARLWRAVDEVLRRSVAIDVLPSHAPRAPALVQAARRSAVVTDGRFLRVLDAAEENGDVYVVREWAPGESLDLVLAEGPLTHRRAAWIVHEVAEAVAVAHSAGIYHLRLTPENVLVTDTGGVKIIGLATDAALHGVRHADAEAEDVRGLGRLLYAALVARWPGGDQAGLPAAPVEHGRVLRPGKVRAGVPRSVDEVCDRILGEPPRHQADPLRHASAVAAELSTTIRPATDTRPQHDPEATQAGGLTALGGYENTSPLPTRDQVVAPRRSLRSAPAADTARTQRVSARTDAAAGGGTWQIPPPTDPSETATSAPTGPPPHGPAAAPAHAEPDSHDRRRNLLLIAAVVAVVAVLAAVSFYVGFTSGGNSNQAQSTPTEPNTTTPASSLLRPVSISSASSWDPFGAEGENDEEVPLALDGDSSTEWTTLSYEGDPEFGGLKPGLGLVLDLGRAEDVSRVTLDVGGSGTDLEVRAAPAQASTRPSSPGDFRTVGSADGASGRTVVRLGNGVSTRFLLVWLTELAPESDSTYSGRISEIDLQG